MHRHDIQQVIDDASHKVREGSSLAAPLQKAKLFPVMLTQMIAVGEDSGELEEMLRRVFAQAMEIPLHDPFPRMSYAEAMQRFGSDKPDLRIPLELVDLGDVMKEVEFKVFAGPANDPNGRIAALRLPAGGEEIRGVLHQLPQQRPHQHGAADQQRLLQDVVRRRDAPGRSALPR